MRRLLQRKLCRRKTLLFTLFLLSLIIGTTPASAKEVTVTFTMSDYGYSNEKVVTSENLSDDFSATFTKGGSNDPKYYTSDETLRIYKNGGTATITTTNSNYTIKSIVGAKNKTETVKYNFTIADDKKSGKYQASATTYFHHFTITYDDGTTSEPQDFDSAHDLFTGLTWNDTSSAYDLTMTYGDTFTLTPKSSTPPAITYAFADGAATDVVNIEGNKLTALKAGSTKITASWPADDNWNADTRTINVTVNHAPVCGDITFSPAAGEVARGTEVTLSCENATEITYTVTPTGGTASEPTTVNANTAKVTINEACTISATAKNKEGVGTTEFTAGYTITAAPLCGDITFSPADGSVVDAGSKVTISCENAAKITYTVITDGVAADPVVVTGASASVTINAACTIKAKAENADGVATEEFTASYTLPVMKDYVVFTDYGADSSIPEGDYIFVGKVTSGDKTYYMEGQNGTNGYRTATLVTPVDGVISVKEVYEIHIQKEADSNYSLITKDGKYLYDSSKNLYEGTDTQGKGKWTPSFENGLIRFKFGSGSNYLYFNASSPRFKTYDNKQAYFYLYAPKSDALGNIQFSPASGSTVDEGTEITISAQNATSLAYSIKTGDVWSESVIITGNSVNVPVTEDCTISVIAKNDETHEQKSADATYTVVHPITYELVEEYNGNDIPDGDYIFASSKDDGSSFAIMGEQTSTTYRESILVTLTDNKFDAYSRYAIKVQKEGNGNYSLITSEGKYLYSNSNQDLKEGDDTYAGKWIPAVTGSTVAFAYADADAVIKYNTTTNPTRFKAYKASSTNGMRPISLYTVATTKCGTVIFNPAPGSKLPVNSKVTIRCKNATQISYSITKEGVYQPTVDVPGNTAEVTITENCKIQAYGSNAEGDSEIVEYDYFVQEPYTRYTDFYAETGDPRIPTGDYIFVGNVSSGELAGSYYMGQGMQGSTGNYREAIKVEPLVDGRIPADKNYAITITKELNGKYTLMTAEGKYLYPEATTSGEGESATTTYSIKESDTSEGLDLWDPHFDANGRIYFWWNGSPAKGEFKFNPQQPRFKNYAASATSTMVSFDLYCAEVPECRNLTFNPASESPVVRGSSVTISCINAAKIFYEVTPESGTPKEVTVVGNTASVIIDAPCTIAAYAENAKGVLMEDVSEATYTVIDPYVQFTEYGTGSDPVIPDGKYIFVGQNGSTGALSYMAEQATATDNNTTYRKAVVVAPFEDGRIGVSESFAIDIKKETDSNYSLITAEGKYLYASTTTTGEGESATTIYSILDGEAADGQGQWIANVAENKVEFVWSDPDMGTLRFNSGASRFKTYDGSTGTKFYLYAPTPKPAQVECKDATITDDKIKISVNNTITFHSEGAGKMACEILETVGEASVETFNIVDGDTYVFTASSKATDQIVTIIPYDQYGIAHTPSKLVVWVTTYDLPKISYNFVDGEDKAAFYAVNGDITEIRPYLIDGTLADAFDPATYPDDVIPFSLAQPRFKVTAKNEIGDKVEESFNFIQELCDRKHIEGGAYSVVINYKDANSAEVASFPIAETERGSLNWTMDGYLVNESDDILETYPFLIKESYITLHIAPYNSDGPIILNVKIATPADGGEGVYGAPAHAPAADDLVATVGNYNFVENGGSPLYFNGQDKNFIKGNIEVSPFEYANIRITSIDDVTTAVSDILDEDAEEVFYNLQGVRVENPDKGIYIRVKGNKTEKILK